MNIHISNIVEDSFQEYRPYISLVVFISKCNLNCYRCPNKGSKSYEVNIESIISKLTNNPLLDALVVIGGEPTTCPNEVQELLTRAKSVDKYTKVFTNACRPSVIQDWLDLGLLNAISVDLKSLDNFEEVSGTDIHTETYLSVFEECIDTILSYPSVELEVRTTQLMKKDKTPLSNIELIKDYMNTKYPYVTHILQDDAFEYM